MTYTVQSWIEHWMEEYQRGNRPSTYQAKVYIIKNHISPNLGCIPLEQLTKKKINEFMEDRRLHGNHRKNSDSYPCLGTEALNNIFRVLYQSLEQAVKDGILESNPAKGFHYRKTKKLKMDPMTKAEAERYLEAAEELGYLAMFELELTSGLSQGELIALKWSDLDTESRLLTVHEHGRRAIHDGLGAKHHSLFLLSGLGAIWNRTDLFGSNYWEMRSPHVVGRRPRNTGVAPRKIIRVCLSCVLEPAPHKRYYLSKTACLGILRRAYERGKELPYKLKRALMIQAGLIAPDGRPTTLETYHINQRDEGIDLHGVSGALMATTNMQMQTFVTQADEEASIAFAANQRDEVRDLHDVAGALASQPGMKQQTFIAAGFSAGQGSKAGGIGYQEELAPTLKGAESGTNMVPSVLCLNDQGGSENLVAQENMPSAYLIRRLTPLECERLQGFPDGWTYVEGASDSARYKALGNSVAIPCVDFVLQSFALVLRDGDEKSA